MTIECSVVPGDMLYLNQTGDRSIVIVNIDNVGRVARYERLPIMCTAVLSPAKGTFMRKEWRCWIMLGGALVSVWAGNLYRLIYVRQGDFGAQDQAFYEPIIPVNNLKSSFTTRKIVGFK